MIELRRGSILDIIGILVIAFLFSATALVSWTILDKFETGVEQTNVPLNTSYIDSGKNAIGVFDYGLAFILFGTMAFVLLAASLIDTHPALFPMGLIILMIIIIAAVAVSNANYELSRSEQMSDAADALPMLVYVMDNLPLILIVYGAILLIVLYGKLSLGGGMSA